MQMSIGRLRALTGVAVVVLAAGSGYFMQHSARVAPVPAVAPAGQVARPDNGIGIPPFVMQDPVVMAVPESPGTPVVTRAASPRVALLSVSPPTLPTAPATPGSSAVVPASTMPMPEPMREPVPDPSLEKPEPVATAPQPTCEIGFTAVAAPGAMVDLTLEAPCRAGQDVDFLHAGTRFSTRLDQRGLVELSAPALEENAVFMAEFSDGETESADTLMLTVSDYQRTALFWQGEAGFSLYALENGAAYGTPGMVSAGQPYGPERGTAGEGGFLAVLGDRADGYHTMVYSWPVRLSDTQPEPEISIEVEIQAQNCGQEVNATVLRVRPGQGAEMQPLFMAVPGCDAIGSYLVLKNLPQAVRIATN